MPTHEDAGPAAGRFPPFRALDHEIASRRWVLARGIGDARDGPGLGIGDARDREPGL